MKYQIWVFTLLLLCGCRFTPLTNSLNSEIKDGGVLSTDPCGPPCFFGITPGQTTELEAAKIISENKNIFMNCKQYDNRAEGGDLGYLCDNNIGLVFSEGVVSGVSFQPFSKITLKQIIDLYGTPDLVDSYVSSLPDKPFINGTSLFFDRIHAILMLDEQSGTKAQINANTTIPTIIYWSAGKYEYMKSLSLLPGVPWHGFGIYEAKLP